MASHRITSPPISRRTVSARLKGPLLMTGQNETLDGVWPKENSPLLASRDPSHKANLHWSLQHEATHGTMDVSRWSRVLRTEYTALIQSGPGRLSLNVAGRQMMPNQISARRRVPPAVQISPSHHGQTRLAAAAPLRCICAEWISTLQRWLPSFRPMSALLFLKPQHRSAKTETEVPTAARP